MDDVTLASILSGTGVTYELVDVGCPTRTAAEAAAALGVPESFVIKSLVCLADDSPVLALVPGDRVLALSKLRAATGSAEIALARGNVIKRATGYPIGAVAPLGHPSPLPTYADRSLRAIDRAYFGGGSHRHMLLMSITDLVRLTALHWADLTEPQVSIPSAGQSADGERRDI